MAADPEGINRTFVGDPNPPAKAPAARPSPAEPPQVSSGGAGSGGGVSVALPEESALVAVDDSEDTYRARIDPDGKLLLSSWSPEAMETTQLGEATLPGAREVLDKVATYNPAMRAWDIPKDVADQLREGRLPLPQYLKAKWATGEHILVGSLNGDAFLRGKMRPEDVVARNEEALLKIQLKESPVFAYQGDFGETIAKMWENAKKAGLSGTARRMAGSATQMAPYAMRETSQAAKGAAVMALVAGTAAAAIGTEGVATPVFLAAAGKAMEGGATLAIFADTARIEAGGTAGEMLKKGFPPETVMKFAPVAGVVKGALEVVGFKFLTAPLKRAAITKVLASAPVQKVLGSALGLYLKETAGEVAAEEAQTMMDIFTKHMAAEALSRDNLKMSGPDVLNELINTAIETAGGVIPMQATTTAAGKVITALPTGAAEGVDVAATMKAGEEYVKESPENKVAFDRVVDDLKAKRDAAGAPAGVDPVKWAAEAESEVMPVAKFWAGIARDRGVSIEEAYAGGPDVRPGKEGAAPEKGQLDQPAFHGSPHKFEKFSLHAIGSGEGAQAYGWGLYFTGKKEIAEFYRDKLSAGRGVTPKDSAARLLNAVKGDKAKAVAEMRRRLELVESDPEAGGKAEFAQYATEVIRIIEADEAGGRLYRVDIPEDENYLHWDKPLSEQPEKVRQALKLEVVKETESSDSKWLVNLSGQTINGFGTKKAATEWAEKATGQELYQAMNPTHGPRKSSALLAEQGVAGIKYLDGSSRAKHDVYIDGAKSTAAPNTIQFMAETMAFGWKGADKALEKVRAEPTVWPDELAKALEGLVGKKVEHRYIDGSYNYVVFDDRLVKVLDYEQKGRGRYLPDDRVIELFKSHDRTTFVHESAHDILEALHTYAQGEDVAPAAAREWAVVQKFLGAENGKELTRDQHEKFARSWEEYLSEGKAPTPELQSVFDRFKAWMAEVYGDAKAALGGQLNDEMRSFFDRHLEEAENLSEERDRESAERKADISPSEERVRQLVDSFDDGEVDGDEFVKAVDVFLDEADLEVEKVDAARKARPAPSTLEEKTRDVESRARIQALDDERATLGELHDTYAAMKTRLVALKRPTVTIDKKMDILEQEIKLNEGERQFYQAEGADAVVGEGETLSMKPATLENVIAAGFKEGGKQSQARAREVTALVKAAGLTEGDVKKLIGGRAIGALSDVEYRHWLEGHTQMDDKGKPKFFPGLKDRILISTERKAARAEVKKILAEKNLRHEARVRQLNELPGVDKMTTAQLKKYVTILSEYEKNDEALTPSLIKANETTEYKGAKTYREVLAIADKKWGKDIGDLRAAGRVDEVDMFLPMPFLAPKNPHFAFAIHQVDAVRAKYALRYQAFRETLYRLGMAAAASRPQGLSRFLSPVMPDVMAYLEQTARNIFTEDTALTPEELIFADFVADFYGASYEYLESVEGLASRYVDKYVFHMSKDIGEILGEISDKGLKTVIKTLWTQWREVPQEMTAVGADGKFLGRRKFMKQTLFRSGKLDPSKNLIKSTNTYARQFFNKQALDEAIPFIETTRQAVKSQAANIEDPEVQALYDKVFGFVNDYLNTQKGHSVLQKVIPQGGKIDGLIRLTNSVVSFLFIAGNAKLQAASLVGETMAMFPAIRAKGVAVGQWRARTAKGKALLAAHAAIVGESPAQEWSRPGRTLDDNFGAVAYSVIQWGRHYSAQVALLASVTPAELESGVISPDRLADIKLSLGRWIDLPGNKSLVGSTSPGATTTKFRGWAIPVMLSTGENLIALGHTLAQVVKKGDPKKRLTPKQTSELLGWLEAATVSLTVTATAAALRAGRDPDDDSPFEKKLLNETWTLLQALSPAIILGIGPTIPFIVLLGKNLTLLGTKYKTGEREGEDRGVAAIKRQFTPSFVKQFQSPEGE